MGIYLTLSTDDHYQLISKRDCWTLGSKFTLLQPQPLATKLKCSKRGSDVLSRCACHPTRLLFITIFSPFQSFPIHGTWIILPCQYVPHVTITTRTPMRRRWITLVQVGDRAMHMEPNFPAYDSLQLIVRLHIVEYCSIRMWADVYVYIYLCIHRA